MDHDQFWDAYYDRLKRVIARRVRAIQANAADASEIALSAINSFIARESRGQFPDLDGDEQLWKLLKTIAIRKANDAAKYYGAAKRGGGNKTIGQAEGSPQGGNVLDAAADSAPDGADAVIYRDLVQNLLSSLTSTRDQDVVLLRLQGASLEVIAECLKVSTRTVRRVLLNIEEEWLKRSQEV